MVVPLHNKVKVFLTHCSAQTPRSSNLISSLNICMETGSFTLITREDTNPWKKFDFNSIGVENKLSSIKKICRNDALHCGPFQAVVVVAVCNQKFVT